ncbi:MSMEG_6728 family protein [Saccharopolyspora thermophila]|nr:MSMEG_6728 family protein [Saccharopolyspora subtropica]
MQTFLPYPGFAETARVLDSRRLGKQRVEALQILRALTVPGHGWRHHPVTAMWAGYEEALACYGLAICGVWVGTGRRDTCAATLRRDLEAATGVAHVRSQRDLAARGELPPWLGDPAFHRSHQSALLRKDRAHYTVFFDGVPDDLPYVWPVSDRARR